MDADERRSKRRLSVASVISLLMLAALIVFWHRGMRLTESAQICWPPRGKVMIASLNGCIGVALQRSDTTVTFFDPHDGPAISGIRSAPRTLDPYDEWTLEVNQLNSHADMSFWHGFMFGRGRGGIGATCPAWALIPFALLFPLRDVRRAANRRRRGASGLCLDCGYDLRHSTDRCPECGTPIHSASSEEIPSDPPKTPPAVTSHP